MIGAHGARRTITALLARVSALAPVLFFAYKAKRRFGHIRPRSLPAQGARPLTRASLGLMLADTAGGTELGLFASWRIIRLGASRTAATTTKGDHSNHGIDKDASFSVHRKLRSAGCQGVLLVELSLPTKDTCRGIKPGENAVYICNDDCIVAKHEWRRRGSPRCTEARGRMQRARR